jgi:DNA-binding IclR family transcriptional regulator
MSTVQSVERSFRLLETLAAVELGLTDLARRVGLPKSTVARLLSTLEELGAVERLEGGARYRLGPGMLNLAGRASPSSQLIARARPQLVLLTRSLAEDSGLSVPEGFRVLYLDQVSAANTVQVRDWTGEHLPMHVVSSGLVMLAALPKEALERYLERELEVFTRQTVTEPARLRRRLEQIHRMGYAWTKEEFAEGISSVAAPIHDRRGRVVAALHVHGPSYRFPPAGSEAAIGRQVREAAARAGG